MQEKLENFMKAWDELFDMNVEIIFEDGKVHNIDWDAAEIYAHDPVTNESFSYNPRRCKSLTM